MSTQKRISIGSDERTHLTDVVAEELRRRGFTLEQHGALREGEDASWSATAERVARDVADAKAEQGILFCWTGTGVSIAANKVPGIRAALCTDATTAEGARRWNDANVLCLSLRLLSPEVAREILDAWLTAQPDESERANIARVTALERAANPSHTPHRA